MVLKLLNNEAIRHSLPYNEVQSLEMPGKCANTLLELAINILISVTMLAISIIGYRSLGYISRAYSENINAPKLRSVRSNTMKLLSFHALLKNDIFGMGIRACRNDKEIIYAGSFLAKLAKTKASENQIAITSTNKDIMISGTEGTEMALDIKE